MSSSLFTSRKIFLGTNDDNGLIDGGVVVGTDGKITRILTSTKEITIYKNENHIKTEIDFGDKILMPGLIDSHVHVNEPGRTDWEGFETATKSAAAGGFTTIADMPLNSIPPTTTVENLNAKIKATENKIYVDVVPWGGVIPTNIDDLPKLIKCGIKAFKCFLCPSGVDEFPHVNKNHVEEALKIFENTKAVLAFHAELELDPPPVVDKSHPEKYETYLNTRPPQMETSAISLVSELAQKFKNARLHIVHLSATNGIPIINECRKNGGNLTVETCYHYLTLNSENIHDGHTEFKCAPPIRDKQNQLKLWEALQRNEINFVASDHSPCTPDLKGDGDFLKAWGGIASNQFGLSLFWTNCKQYNLGLSDLYKFMCQNPAKHLGIDNLKGKLAEGFDGDICVWDPNEEFLVVQDIIQFKNKITPYMGNTIRGVVYATILRGQIIFEKSKEFRESTGKILL